MKGTQEYEEFVLPNNIRILHKQVSSTKVVHCGFMLDIGSRDEEEREQGLAHFWEHMAFKGTTHRRAFHILNRIESVGGELNAYTTREKVAFYASVLDQHFQKAVDLLCDITFNSIFPEKQIIKERNVILEEMSMYQDTPEDALQDDFDEQLFRDHPLGRNILGTSETVRSFRRKDFLEFIGRHMDTDKIVFSVVGNVPFEKVVKTVSRYLEHVPVLHSAGARQAVGEYSPSAKEIQKPINQAHCAIGRPSYSILDTRRIPFFTLVNILGGPGMNSRLNLALREKYGFVYGIDANYHAFSDTGMFAIYFATDPGQLRKSIRLVKKELRRLKEQPLGTLQLHHAKQQLMGQLAMAEENNVSLMLMMAKSMLDIGRIEPLETIFTQIKALSSTELCDIANEMFAEDELSELIFLPA